MQREILATVCIGQSPVHQRTRESFYQSSRVGLEPMPIVQTPPNIVVKTRHWWVESPLRRIGIQQRRTTRSVVVYSKEHTADTVGRVSITSDNYDAFWGLLGYGIHWSRQYPCGIILPSFRVYPIVERFHFDESHHKLPIWTSSIEEVQQAFYSGALHPFTKDINGYSLLHVRLKTLL